MMDCLPFTPRIRSLALPVRSVTVLWLLLWGSVGLPHGPVGAAEPVLHWRPTGTLGAPEAVQAAAADEQFLYAIGSTQIGKYDRRTGERVALSTGAATHLNSGFFWKGTLYCAHSNYPQTPEQSEIKTLNVETMQLATLKDFGNFGGSLTWVVHYADRWWCNFARYGDANAGTFLVQFDDAWQELARWTYPPEVIRELGRYSLSGGIWRDGDLYVTGHDDRVLFRLRLPDEGSVPHFVERQAAPFTGQGIAADPATGGLVGIDRGKRRIVLASPESTDSTRLRVLTYNIHHGEGVDGRIDLSRIARVILSAEPDVVALQEVDRNTRRAGGVDQAAALARLTMMEPVFGGNITFEGGEYGNAVLSLFPVRRHENHKLPCLDDGEQRGVLEVEFERSGVGPQLLFATHLDHRHEDRERLASATMINHLARERGERPMLLAGDLNDVPESAVLQELANRWTRANHDIQPTIPVGQPTRQIDYVLFRPARAWTVVETKVLDEAIASDHRAVLAVLELTVSAASPPAPAPRVRR